MSSKYPWALNEQKLARAIGVVGEQDVGELKAEYIKIGGLLSAEEKAVMLENTSGTDMPEPIAPESITSTEDIEEKPKKIVKKKNAK